MSYDDAGNEMLDRIRGSLDARAEGRQAGGDKQVMEAVDLIVKRESTAESCTKIQGEITDPSGQAETLAKLIMAMMMKQGITTFNLSEHNFTDCNGWMFSLRQVAKNRGMVLQIVMERIPQRETGN